MSTKIITAAAIAALLTTSACAATVAYLQRHPTDTEAAQLVASAVNCVMHAGSDIALEMNWLAVLGNALACADQLVKQGGIDPQLRDELDKAVHREVSRRQDKAIQRARVRVFDHGDEPFGDHDVDAKTLANPYSFSVPATSERAPATRGE